MTFEEVEVILLLYLGAIFLIGVPGNILVLRVYLKRAKSSGTFVFISFVAIADLIICLSTPLPGIFVATRANHPRRIICKTVTGIFVACSVLSLVSSAVVAFDRYVAVCRPYSKRLSVRTSLILSAVCFMISLICAIPPIIVADISSDKYNPVICLRADEDGFATTVVMTTVVFTVVFPSIVSTLVFYSLTWKSIRNHRLLGIVNKETFSTSNRLVESSNVVTNEVALSIQNNESNDELSTGTHSVVRNPPGKSVPVTISIGESDTMKREKETQVELHRNLKDESRMSISSKVIYETHSVQYYHMLPLEAQCHPGRPAAEDSPHVLSRSTNVTWKKQQRNKATIFIPKMEPAKEKNVNSQSIKMGVQRRITLMLFLTAVLSLTTIPITLFAKSLTINKMFDIKIYSKLLFHLLYLSGYFGLIKNALDPFIYSLCDKKFRKECKNSFKCLAKEEV